MLNQKLIEALPSEIKYDIYCCLSRNQKAEVCNKVPELRYSWYERDTSEVLLIIRKRGLECPIDITEHYGKVRKQIYIDLPASFNCHLPKHRSYPVEMEKLDKRVEDALKNELSPTQKLRIVLAFDIVSGDCFDPLQVYWALWKHFRDIPHSVDIIKAARDISEFTKSKDRKLALFDATSDISIKETGYHDSIVFNTPIFKLAEEANSYIRATTLFEPATDSTELLALRNEIISLTSTLHEVNIVTPKLDTKLSKKVIKSIGKVSDSDIETSLAAINSKNLSYIVRSAKDRYNRYLEKNLDDIRECFYYWHFRALRKFVEVRPSFLYLRMPDAMLAGQVDGVPYDVPARTRLADSFIPYTIFYHIFSSADKDRAESEVSQEDKDVVVKSLKTLVETLTRKRSYSTLTLTIFNNSKETFTAEPEAPYCSYEECRGCQTRREGLGGKIHQMRENQFTQNKFPRICLEKEYFEARRVCRIYISEMNALHS